MAKKMALGSRPKYEARLVGIVSLTTGKDTAKLVMLDEGKTFLGGQDEIRVKLSDLPAIPKIKPNDIEGKRYRVRMSADGTEVESLGPVNGTFDAVAIDMSRPGKDQPPAPYDKVWNEGKDNENRHREFWVSYKITQGYFKGVILPAYKLHYKFEQNPDDEELTRFAGNFENKKATRLFQLRDWGMAHDLWDEPIPWPEDGNILPELLDRLLTNEKEVKVVIKDGYPIDVVVSDSYEEYDEPESDDVDEEFPKVKAKAPAKKVTKKSAPVKGTKKSRRNDF